ncbi:hypothetical protein ACIX90_02725 [Actinobacillus pleuropneumoniae]|uniref:hypothetical protein n=1 Tax=Actinobacillus pleuropneumoniae TaxID=715 RepID=UPI000584B3B0|nr:hypothetical protein [Actinobacillus pleuropneumoniae]KIE87710.1 hypothetical protein AP1022_03026 [Actinobacillus pleuropneumoniae]KIE92349.1 hypothetical protein AP518_02754 [Actinobacillus pleuropneumoniae]KIE97569.1 hypothetical protein AP5651_02760 [Actinobacillus pleuropneumoniae]KIE99182.1 hypothetical protein AP780_02717 [Actinobacillus pleuropneumoniae]QXP22550.1 hypothetical protein KV188_10370 [Actinobacillus pleuropneumoniae serovar 8 str. 405]
MGWFTLVSLLILIGIFISYYLNNPFAGALVLMLGAYIFGLMASIYVISYLLFAILLFPLYLWIVLIETLVHLGRSCSYYSFVFDIKDYPQRLKSFLYGNYQ